MDAQTAEAGTWGDPYLGIRLTTYRIQYGISLRFDTGPPWERLRRIRGGAPGIFDDIAAFLRGVLDRFAPWNWFPWLRWTVFDPVAAWMRDHIFNPLRSMLNTVIGTLTGTVAAWLSAVRAAISGLPGQISGAIQAVSGAISGWLSPRIEAIRNALEARLGGLQGILAALPGQIVAVVGNVASTVWNVGVQLFNTIAQWCNQIVIKISTFADRMVQIITNQGRS